MNRKRYLFGWMLSIIGLAVLFDNEENKFFGRSVFQNCRYQYACIDHNIHGSFRYFATSSLISSSLTARDVGNACV